ncbi:MAG: serine/threonine-protein phosphatase [bacterium]|nr:serine/threonine-protein phosphatase [bacterium]
MTSNKKKNAGNQTKAELLNEETKQTLQKVGNAAKGAGKMVMDDFRSKGLSGKIKQEFTELIEYYLDEQQQKRLDKMNWFERSCFISGWFIKGLYLKLTPVRRIALLLGGILVGFYGNPYLTGSIGIWGGLVLLLIVIMLELKDKLLARDELEAGRTVQKAMMPDRMPAIPGWEVWLFTRPANEVGGDLVDFLKISETHYGVALGDVSGKGLSAALLMSKLQTILRTLAPDFMSMDKLGSKLNEVFYRNSLPNVFASLVYLELDMNSGSVRFMNAGHLPPIAVKEGNIKKTAKGSLALGITNNAAYKEQNLELRDGDFLLIYSDGLTEAQNEKEEFFGESPLWELLPKWGHLDAEKIGNRLLDKLSSFVGNARAFDDLSLVVLKRCSQD